MKKGYGLCAVTLLGALLSGCSSSPQRALPEAAPTAKLADYQALPCEEIWRHDYQQAWENPLYWMRTLTCADELPIAEAGVKARQSQATGWAQTFRQAILLARGNPRSTALRESMAQLKSESEDYPPAVSPAIRLWIGSQQAQFAASDAQLRLARVQQSSETQLEALRQQQKLLRKALDDTQQKLQRLTDIERQLSARKAADLTESSHAQDTLLREEP